MQSQFSGFRLEAVMKRIIGRYAACRQVSWEGRVERVFVIIIQIISMQGDLEFGEDCVIKLEDLGEFKDYSETMETLSTALQALPHNPLAPLPTELWEVIDSDPEDTYFLPLFQTVVALMPTINWKQITTPPQHLKIIAFYFQIVEQALISYSFGEEIVQSLVKQITEAKEDPKVQKLVLRLLFRLSDKVMYVEEVERLLVFWGIANEEIMFGSFGEDHSDKVGAVYAECCEKFLRNRQFRRALNPTPSQPFLSLKMAVWQRDKIKIADLISRLQVLNFHNSPFLKEMSLILQKQLTQL